MSVTAAWRPGPLGRALGRAAALGAAAVRAAVGVAGATARPALAQLRDHGYSLAAAGFFDAAGYVHSVFAGLVTTGLSLMVFEWKVSE